MEADPASAGQTVTCPNPNCARQFTVAPPVQPVPAPAGQVIYCPRCGESNHENNFKCTRCGNPLHSPPPIPAVQDASTMGGLIPKNPPALWGYYLAIFSLIPCLGIPLGLAAVVCGVLGLKHARKHPAAKGKVHAWIGIILGGLCALAYILLFATPLLLRAWK